MSKSFKYIGALCASLVLSACSTTETQQDYSTLVEDELALINDNRASEWKSINDTDSSSYLTDLIQDTQLNSLIQQALQANPSLQKTKHTLQASLISLRSQYGDSLPIVEASFSGDKTEGDDISFDADLTISWELDLWRKLANSEQSTAKSFASEEALYQASRDLLAANVIKSWLAITAKQHAIDIEKKRLELLSANEKLILKRFRNGLGSLEELDSSRTSTSQSKADLIELEENLAIEFRTLQVYLGSTESVNLAANVDYPQVILPLSDLPTQTLKRRPDLQAAYLNIEAADLNTSVAYKDMLPSISLKATLSETASSPTRALFGEPLWTLLAELTQPIYNGGQLKAAVEIAKLETAQAYQDYRDTLLTAVNEVETAIGQEKVFSLQEQHIQDALTSSKKNLTQYETKYRNGLIEISDLIDVQTTTYDLEAQLDNIIYQRLSNRVDLGLALGLGANEQ